MKKSIFAAIVLFLIITSSIIVHAQDLKEKYKVFNRTITLDKQSGVIHLNQLENAGIAWIIGKTLINGVIEFDIKGKDEFQKSFIGIAFHGLNDTTYESIYFRPFNFRTDDPVRKGHAVQYIANPKYDWPKLRADLPNQFEQPVPSTIDPSQWFHVKLMVKGKQISVYVNGSPKPVLEVQSLVNTGGKMIGYWVGNGSDGDWKNLKIPTH